MSGTERRPLPVGLDESLSLYVKAATHALGDRLIGVWAGGSLALGDFDPVHSDVDLVAVTRDRMSVAERARVEVMHRELAGLDKSWLGRLEVLYLAQVDLRPDSNGLSQRVPAMEKGSFTVVDEDVGAEIWIYLSVLGTAGFALHGPEPRTMTQPVPAAKLRHAAAWVVERWVAGWIREPQQLEPVSFRRFAVLTCCRLLYTFATGGVASKPAAARWARADVAESWALAIDASLAFDAHHPPDLDATKAVILHTIGVVSEA